MPFWGICVQLGVYTLVYTNVQLWDLSRPKYVFGAILSQGGWGPARHSGLSCHCSDSVCLSTSGSRSPFMRNRSLSFIQVCGTGTQSLVIPGCLFSGCLFWPARPLLPPQLRPAIALSGYLGPFPIYTIVVHRSQPSWMGSVPAIMGEP